MPRDDDDSTFDEAQSSIPGERRPLSGSYLGVTWRVVEEGGHLRLLLGDRSVHIERDDLGSFVSHALVGRWRNLEEMAQMILRYHPDYSPLARDSRPPLVS